MQKFKSQNISAAKQVWRFIVHLRWHYQLFILSGGFLLGGFLSPDLDWNAFLIQFLNIHLLLFGGATAYNSYWDKDEGPIGGLRNPPKMMPWMWWASLMLQGIGLLIAIFQGLFYSGIYVLSMLFFWLYSTPLARWKRHPVKSLVAIGVSTGLNSVLLGYIAAGNIFIPFWIFVAAGGTILMLLALYPVSQMYQITEDRKRGDQTFAVQYGKKGVIRFFVGAFVSGLLMVGLAMGQEHFQLTLIFAGLGMLICAGVWNVLLKLQDDPGGYSKVMWIKYGTSMSFVLFLITGLILKHAEINGISAVANLLLE